MKRKKTIIAVTLLFMLVMTAYGREREHGHEYDHEYDHKYDRLESENDIIYASPAAEGDILGLLRRDHDVVTFEDEVPRPFILGPVVVTAADLDNPTATWLLKEAYGAGRTVAVIDATQDEADRFHRFFGEANQANCEPVNGAQAIELYGLQASIDRRPRLISSYCLAGVAKIDKRRRDGRRTRQDLRRWLQERFAQTAPEPSAANVTDDSQNIVDLATATHCSYYTTSDPANLGRQLQVDTYVTGARSFINSEDIYYVENKLQYQQGTSGNPNYAFAVLRVGATGVTQFQSGESDSQPESVGTFVTSVTNTTTQTISGSVGFNAMGPTGTVGGSVSHGRSVMFSLPPTQISNNTTPSPPLPQWTFERQTVSPNETFEPETSWFWTIPMDSYADMGQGVTGALSVRYFLSMGGTFDQPTTGDFAAENTCNVLYPFNGLWADSVGNPTITSLSPTSVAIGEQFTITGEQLYPGLVTAVFIDGTAIDIANVTPKGESPPKGSGVFTVEVLVPSETNGSATPTGEVPIEIQTEFNGQTTNSNAMSIKITD